MGALDVSGSLLIGPGSALFDDAVKVIFISMDKSRPEGKPWGGLTYAHAVFDGRLVISVWYSTILITQH